MCFVQGDCHLLFSLMKIEIVLILNNSHCSCDKRSDNCETDNVESNQGIESWNPAEVLFRKDSAEKSSHLCTAC